MSFRVTLPGQPYSKANSRQLVTFNGRMRSIKSKNALEYVNACFIPVRRAINAQGHLTYNVPVRLTAVVYYKTKRPDLDESLIMDILEKYEVYENDRLIHEKRIYKRFDKDNPRTEILVEPLSFEEMHHEPEL